MISIIVPVYNSEKYLKACIESILRQTYKDYEIIIVNDGSTDSSQNIIDSYKHLSNIIIINKNNEGLSSARNAGLDAATGKYVSFLDSDDIIHQHFLETLLNAIEENDVDFVCCNYITFNSDKELNYKEEQNYEQILYNNINTYLSPADGLYTPKIISCAKIYKRSLFNNLRFDLNKYHEDEFIIHKIAIKCSKILFLNTPLYYYRNNPLSITRNKRTNKMNYDACDAFFERIKYLRKHNIRYEDDSIAYSINNIGYYSNPSMISKRLCVKYFRIISNYNKLLFLQSIISKKRFSIKYLLLIICPFLYKIVAKLTEINSDIKNPIFRYNFKYHIYFLYKTIFYKCNVAYVGSITHGNLGDQAIAEASIKFLKNTGLRPIDVPSNQIHESIKRYLHKHKTLIVLRGGGNIGNDWLSEEIFHRKIISEFKDNKIVIFPESIHFSSDNKGVSEASITRKVYSSHPNLSVVCREKQSYIVSTTLFSKNKSILCPDMVFSLKTKKHHNKAKTYKACIIKRDDKEKLLENELAFKKIRQYLLERKYKVEDFSTVIPDIQITLFDRRKYIKSFLQKLSEYDYVITDRLHGMIFSYISNIPCLALDNSTKKISNSFSWISNNNHMILYKNISSVRDLLLLNKHDFTKTESFNDEFYKLERLLIEKDISNIN